MRDPAKSATYLSVGLIVVGFVVIVLGWYGAARLDHTPGQIPYLISGGFSGLGLILAGLTLVVVQESRRDRTQISAKLDALLEAQRRQVATGPATNGSGAVGSLVVLGRTVFHASDCRLVEGRGDLEQATPGDAAARGLGPCRICAPDASDVPDSAWAPP